MPRIDPLQLLKCLSVLLSPDGGILSRDEVPRLVNLMTKFSKKLVSKCVYVLILKSTESSLVDMFMAEGGWALIQTWLQDAIHMSNWDLVKEILGLLLVTPVDVERLKLNNIPKLIKSLSRQDDLKAVQQLSSQLVQHWLVIVKGTNQTVEVAPAQVMTLDSIKKEVMTPETCDISIKELPEESNIPEGEDAITISASAFYKLSVKDEKQLIKKLEDPESPKEVNGDVETKTEEKIDEDERKTSDKIDKTKSKSSSKTSSSKSSSSSSSNKSSSDKDKRRSSSSSSSKSSSGKDRTRDKDRDKTKDRDKKDKDRHRSNGSSSSKHSKSGSSSGSSRDKERRDSKDKDKTKEKQAEKDKDTLEKIKPQSVDKLGRIPKKITEEKSKENKDVKKKPTMSIEVRKNNEERPKTVKIFNSKMRSTGLEEEVKPPPPRGGVKKPSLQLPTIPPKRPSPPRIDTAMPPEKKLKVEIPDKMERPGAIKLIPPKPKPAVLQESDIFMDALTASATTKKEPKKRKRRTSVSKETPSSPTSTGDQPQTPNSPLSSPLGLKNIAPINFYQDTLNSDADANESENNKETSEESKTENNDKDKRPSTPIEEDSTTKTIEPKRLRTDGLKGVLLFSKKKGPKRSIQWKSDSDLVEIRYFELDETERVNVTKTFMDMAKMEMSSEREALQMSRKLSNEDLMEPQTMWRLPYVIEQPDALIIPGNKSLEKDIQFAREKSVLQAFYFDKRRIPDSPEEPIPENHQMSDPVIIPLDDDDSQEIDMRNTPWPEPKGSPPHIEPQMPPQIFQNIPGPFNPNFPQMQPPNFPAMPPRFNGPGPTNFMPPNTMMPNGGNMIGPPNMGPPPEMMNQGPINPNMFGPGPGNDGFVPMNDGPNFPMPFNQPNMNMYPPNNNFRGRGGFRGRNNNSPWIRMNGPGNWNNRGGGPGHRPGRLCKNIKNHGYCRNIDNCPFVHPN